ncbi:hypothetical protein RIF23_05520 [Lipingzhangella sp. LS1_29]|uniref:Sensor histidine kinase n=1 Tax=Lipingzhangella rawalii TaxID=2055835 RepID=A0ABU2H4K0_9ACTN|nr:hypothetical protein [Lipingzhangella rawalii]MDS1269750.1 hypothetical protein [Lipingzhangella rawalii]
MRSGRHGAARPPLGVLIRRDRIDVLLHSLLIVLSVIILVFAGGLGSVVFWAALLIPVVSATLLVRRMDRLSRDELRGGELL